MKSKVIIYSRKNCHLCHEAENIVREVLLEVDFELEIIYIDGNVELELLYGEEVPVTLINGKKHAYFSIEAVRFSSALKSRLSEKEEE